MNWFVLGLISVFSLSLFYVTAKKILNKDKSDPRIFGGLMQLTVGLLSLPIVFSGDVVFNITPLTVFLLLAMGVIYTISPSLYYTGLKKIDLSEAVILESTGVFWGLLIGVAVLGESFTFVKLTASLLIFASVFIITKWKNIKVRGPEILILGSAVFYAIGTSIDNRLIDFSNATTYLSLAFLVAGIMMIATNFPRFKKHKDMFSQKNFWKLLFINSVFVVVSYWALFKAYEIGGEVSSLYPILNIQTIIIPIFGVLFLGEKKNLKRKFAALCLTILALYLLKP